MIKLIGLAGAATCGKNTLADYITREHGHVQEAFAMPIKKAIASMLGVPVSVVERGKEEGVGPAFIDKTYRELLQTLGTEWGRDLVDENFWNKLLKNKLEIHSDSRIVITDVRFNNEAQMIREMGGVVIYIKRNEAEGHNMTHASENSLSVENIDYYLDNDKTLEHLYGRFEVLTGVHSGSLS